MSFDVTLGGYHVTAAMVTLGLIIGATYGILAVGLVLVYRVNRIVNFAHGEIGLFGAAAMYIAVTAGLPYWLGFVLALAVAGAVGGLVEVGVIRRLRRAPRLMSVIATLGFAQFLSLFTVAVNAQSRSGSLFPEPPGLPQFHVQHLLVTPAHTAMLVFTPVVVVALVAFLRFSRYGIALRAAAANPDAARLDGVFAARMSTMAWVIAGVISGFTAVLILPTIFGASTFGPGLVVRALVAAVLARMSNLTIAFVGGLGVGVVEQVLLQNNPSGGEVEAVLFAIILVALLLLQPRGGRVEERGSTWATVITRRPLPDAYQRIFLVRHGATIVAAIALLAAIALPAFIGFGDSFALTEIFSLAIVGLSVGVVTGLAGQLSLGQFALAAIGATAAVHVARATDNYLLAILAGGVAGALASAVVGIPALRIRGLMLAVTTLSLALMTEAWLLQQPWMLGFGADPGHPVIGTLVLSNAKSYYLLALVVLVLSLWLARNIRHGAMGRIFVAIRDNEDAARAFSIAATGRKLQAFGLAGFLAGIGGSVFAFGITRISFDTFHADTSINVVAMAVIGGIGLLIGPLLGALYMIGIPAFVPVDSTFLAAQAAGWLLLILYVPGGLAALVQPLRDRAAGALARMAGIAAEAAPVDQPEPGEATLSSAAAPDLGRPEARPLTEAGTALLIADRLLKRYGGVTAVDGVSLEVREGETLGLIGPNGAGKTTLFELLSGFNQPDSGTITYAGKRLERTLSLRGRVVLRRSMGPEQRGRLGLVRSFQDASLFPTMTVEEVLMLALERWRPSTMFASVVGSSELERPKRARAAELVEMMGLQAFARKPISELSTGTRRIAELGCMIALSPRLLLLDEPSSGIAQRETEALGDLLRRVKSHLGATLVVIEHDIPLVMGLADRVIAMESGRIIAEGAPADIRRNQLVIESYLGGDINTIERSGKVPAASGSRA